MCKDLEKNSKGYYVFYNLQVVLLHLFCYLSCFLLYLRILKHIVPCSFFPFFFSAHLPYYEKKNKKRKKTDINQAILFRDPEPASSRPLLVLRGDPLLLLWRADCDFRNLCSGSLRIWPAQRIFLITCYFSPLSPSPTPSRNHS